MMFSFLYWNTFGKNFELVKQGRGEVRGEKSATKTFQFSVFNFQFS